MTAANVFSECCQAEGLAAFIHCPGNYAIQNALAEAGIPSYGGRRDGHMGHACDAFYRVTCEIAAFNAQWGGASRWAWRSSRSRTAPVPPSCS